MTISATHVYRCGLILTSDPVEMVIMREASTEHVRNVPYQETHSENSQVRSSESASSDSYTTRRI